jgi:hypothetical protein
MSYAVGARLAWEAGTTYIQSLPILQRFFSALFTGPRPPPGLLPGGDSLAAKLLENSMDERTEPADGGSDLPGMIRSWVMVALTLIFILLYALALTGWLKPLADERMVARLEPVIFVIIGYYFGRLPAQANEHTLKGEINRQTKKADAAQNAKEQVQRTAETFEERLKNARVTLAATAPSAGRRARAENVSPGSSTDDSLRHSVDVALSILNS